MPTRLCKSDMRGLVYAGPWVRSRSWAAGLEVERDLLRGNVIAHRTGADHSETLTQHRGGLTWTFMWAPAQSSRTASDQDQPASSRAIAALATTGRSCADRSWPTGCAADGCRHAPLTCGHGGGIQRRRRSRPGR